jgi:very-short-patch-repair endonuclease
MTFLYNNLALKAKRRGLRRNQTDAERRLWSQLRNKKLGGLKFFRQYSVGPYILDFYCPAQKFAIEIDGGQHAEAAQQHSDERRSEYLAMQKIRVLRFWNNEVLQNLEGVWAKITEEVNPTNPPQSPLNLRGEVKGGYRGGAIAFAIFIFYLLFLILPLPAEAQIVPVPGTSCNALPETERNECRKAICPRECRQAGLFQGGITNPTPTCTDDKYTYSYCTFGKCIYEESAGKGPPQNINPNELENALPCNYTLEDLVGAGVRVAMFIFGIAGSLAFLFFVYGGYQMVTALGNPEAINAAKKTLTGAVIGLILILTAGFVVRFVGGLILPQAGEEISSGLIIPAGGACTSDAQCGAGMTCAGGVCRTRCEMERGSEGYFCQALACTCPNGAVKCPSSDCGPGLQCLDGGCVRAPEACAQITDRLEKQACEKESTRSATIECEKDLCPGGEFNQCCRVKPGS